MRDILLGKGAKRKYTQLWVLIGLREYRSWLQYKKEKMTQKEIQDEVIKFTNAETIEAHLEYLELFIECFTELTFNHHEDRLDSQSKADADAKMILQMMTSKLIHLKKLTEGIKFHDDQLNPIIDPIVITCLVRNIYETVCLFNIVYDVPDSNDKRRILYVLWVAAGLNYRQRFTALMTSDENKEKAKKEKGQIEELKKAIEETQEYKNLNEKNQKKIQTKIKEKDFKIKIVGGEVNFLNWQEISQEFCTEFNMFEEMYNYFSQYAHPSNVSVFQYAQMFKPGEEAFKRITANNIRFCIALASIFLADFIRLFPETKSTFENRRDVDQIILNFYNSMMRGEQRSINEAWKKLE